MAGFTSGEGCFYIKISNSKTGTVIQLVFLIGQHSKDEQLMKSLIKYFGAGYDHKYREAIEIRISKFSDLTEKVIPFFEKYPIVGVKALDFSDFCCFFFLKKKPVAELMKNKAHLTSEGLDQIRQIKMGMNKGR